MEFLCFLDQLMDVEFESLGKHLVNHSDLVGVCIQVTQFIFLVMVFFDVFKRGFYLSIVLQGLILEGRMAKLSILIDRLRLKRLFLTSLLLHHRLLCYLTLQLVPTILNLILVILWRLKLKLSHYLDIGLLVHLILKTILINLHIGTIGLSHVRCLHQILSIQHLTLNIEILGVLVMILKILITHFLFLKFFILEFNR